MKIDWNRTQSNSIHGLGSTEFEFGMARLTMPGKPHGISFYTAHKNKVFYPHWNKVLLLRCCFPRADELTTMRQEKVDFSNSILHHIL